MANSENQDFNLPIKRFFASKQTAFFKGLKQAQFSGDLTIISRDGLQWHFYLYLGRLIYGSGGEHSVRRWRRNLTAYLPQIAGDISYLEHELQSLTPESVKFCWEYELLRRWLRENKAQREAVMSMVMAILREIFFDLNQTMEIYFFLNDQLHIPITEQISLMDTESVIIPAWEQWQNWVSAKLGDRSPNKAPVIRLPEQLKQKTSPTTYNSLEKILNGKNTLRDLAIQLKRDLVKLGNFLIPYVQEGYIELVSIPDLPAPVAQVYNELRVKPPLIACVDDSQMICEIMQQIIEGAGYEFLGITDPMKAIAELLAHKPDLIFLDLVMPNTNGYEICSGLKKLSFFRQTPIIILTGNDNMLDRVRTKMLGSSDFLTKPVNPQQVLEMISKHLPSRIAH